MVNPSFVYKGLPPPGIIGLCYLATAVLLTIHGRWWGLVFLWPALLYALITYAYIFDGSFGAGLLQKRASTDGGIPLLRLVLFFPYLLTSWTIWWVRHMFLLRREDGYNLVAPGIFLGRFPLWLPCRRADSSGAFPEKERVAVVDLCAEFPALPWVVDQAQGRYFCLPCLDGDMPEDKVNLLRVAQHIADWGPSTPVYVHCANGRGRSCCFVALVMLLRGDGPGSVDEALLAIKRSRPQVRAQRAQRALIAEVLGCHPQVRPVSSTASIKYEVEERQIGMALELE